MCVLLSPSVEPNLTAMHPVKVILLLWPLCFDSSESSVSHFRV